MFGFCRGLGAEHGGAIGESPQGWGPKPVAEGGQTVLFGGSGHVEPFLAHPCVVRAFLIEDDELPLIGAHVHEPDLSRRFGAET